MAEGAVDALSLAQIERCHVSQAFLSTAGAPSRSQCRQTGPAARTLPNFSFIVLAQDGDEAGDRQAETLRQRPKVSRTSLSGGGTRRTTPTGTTTSGRADGPDCRHETARPNRFRPTPNAPENLDHTHNKAGPSTKSAANRRNPALSKHRRRSLQGNNAATAAKGHRMLVLHSSTPPRDRNPKALNSSGSDFGKRQDQGVTVEDRSR